MYSFLILSNFDQKFNWSNFLIITRVLFQTQQTSLMYLRFKNPNLAVAARCLQQWLILLRSCFTKYKQLLFLCNVFLKLVYKERWCASKGLISLNLNLTYTFCYENFTAPVMYLQDLHLVNVPWEKYHVQVHTM